MADTIKEKITNQLLVMAEAILITNGFETDMGEHSYLTCKAIEEDDLPATSLFPSLVESAPDYGAVKHEMKVSLECFILAEKTDIHSSLVNKMEGDVRKKFETADATLAALIESIDVTSADPVYPESSSDTVSVNVGLKVTYKTVRGDPHTKA